MCYKYKKNYVVIKYHDLNVQRQYQDDKHLWYTSILFNSQGRMTLFGANLKSW